MIDDLDKSYEFMVQCKRASFNNDAENVSDTMVEEQHWGVWERRDMSRHDVCLLMNIVYTGTNLTSKFRSQNGFRNLVIELYLADSNKKLDKEVTMHMTSIHVSDCLGPIIWQYIFRAL